MEFGEHAEMLELMPTGEGPVPDPPELWLENAAYLNAWFQLNSTRPPALSGVVGIAPTEIECWARHCWQRPNESEFIRRMLAADSAYCTAVIEKQAKEAPPPS